MINAHHHCQRPENIAILNHVQSRGQCTGHDLIALFCHDPAVRYHHQRFIKKLSYLVDSAQLQRLGSGRWADSTFTLGERAGRPPASAAKIGRPPKAAASAPNMSEHAFTYHIPAVATPPAYDAMHAPLYTGTSLVAHRPGALDYKRYASRGNRC